MIYYRRLLTAFAVASPAVLVSSCITGANIGYKCGPDGDCPVTLEVIWKICPNGRVTRDPTTCNKLAQPPEDLAGLDLRFSTPYGVTYTATSGIAKLTIQGGPALNTGWVVQSGKIVLANPISVGNWLIANAPAQVSDLTAEIPDARIHAPGDSANQTVTITAKVRFNGTVIDSMSTSYVYYPPPPPTSWRLEKTGGDCNWLVTSLASHPAYTFIIEKRGTLGGTWLQTYSGQDSCVARSGAYSYRTVYADIFGNRGPTSGTLNTNCNPGPAP